MVRSSSSGLTRRQLLASGLAGTLVVLAGAFELVDHGVLPGRRILDELDGACSVPIPAESFRKPGATLTGKFFSRARNREVGYTLAYPPGHTAGTPLPLGLYLHADGGNHASPLGGLPLARALAGHGLPAIALIAVDGGNLYWHPHPGDNPMAMLIEEVIPMCQRLGLGRRAGSIGAIGISMGGYGTILLAEKHPETISAAAAIGPAIWTSYAEARAANAGAFTNEREFADNNVLAGARSLAHTPLRIASGASDPFHLGVVALAQLLPRSSTVDISSGCHDASFFASQRHASIKYLGEHLSA
jgi:hypothetical protein